MKTTYYPKVIIHRLGAPAACPMPRSILWLRWICRSVKSTLTLSILSIALLAFLPGMAQADLVMIQHRFTGAAKTPSPITLSIKDGKVRTDNDTTSTSIIDTATGDMTTLVHEQKMVMTMNTKQLQDLSGKEAPVKIPETKVTATGKHETIDGKDCGIYTSENPGMIVRMWIAKDYPGYAKLKEALKPLTKMTAGSGNTPELPGMMLKSEFEQSGLKLVTKLVSIEEKILSDDLFKAPAGYKAPGQ